ncbi:MAG: hypothetical protein LBQ46_02680 [Treponema sp.]|jgi:hypothetical protein|nr:hypothetical protein [Treponema sp.]
MIPRKNQNVKKESPSLSDMVVYAGCFLGIVFSLNFFRLDLFRTLERQTEQPVGTITFKYKAAQRRFSDRVLWERLKKESPVYDGDLIRTADLSEAMVTFAGGGAVIDLLENSLIQIREDNQGFSIDLTEGGLNVSAADTRLLVRSAGAEIEVDAGTVLRVVLDGGDLHYRVLEGAALVTGGARTLERGAAALFPRPSARFLYPGTGKTAIPFRWTRLNLTPEEPALLEVAEDRNFTRVVFREEYTGDSASVDLDAGSYFWRVAAGEDAGLLPDTFAFRVIAAPAPVLITPVQDYYYQFRVKRPAVRFQWTESGEAASYLLEAAGNRDLRNPSFTREVRGTSLYTSELGPGTWYWRVRPLFPAGYQGAAGEAAASSFEIRQSGELLVPQLRNPEDRDMVNIAAGREDLYFSWLSEAEARSYTIRISPNPDLSDPLITGTVQDNYYVYRAGEDTIKAGQFFWAVFQTDTEGNNSSPSPARFFTALEGEVIQRTVFPPESYTIAAAMMPDIRFTWKTNLPLQTYLQISDQDDFSRLVLDEAVNGDTFHGRVLPEGIWYWRIQARGPGGAVLETPPKSFTAAPPLPAPALIEPGVDGRVVILEEEDLRFSWEPSPGAEYYQFKLYRGQDRTRAFYEDNLVEGRTLSLPLESLPEGSFSWTVQAFAPENLRSTRRTGLLSSVSFVLRKIHPVTLDYPGDGAEIDGLRAYFDPETLRWTSIDEPVSSRFILSREADFTGTPIAVFNNPQKTFTLPPRLREGDYYWTIRAETEDGLDIGARSSRRIRVLPIPPLPEPANPAPRNGMVFTGTELRRDRRISFAWNAVPGATGYRFTVEQQGRAVLPEQPLKENGFVLDDLTLLDRGEYVWRVEAILEDQGEIIRRGAIAENLFKIDFALPARPVLLDPGTLYGRE